MGLIPFQAVKRLDADTMGIYHNNMTKLLNIDKATADTTTISGQDTALDNLSIRANSSDVYPNILFNGDAVLSYSASVGGTHKFYNGTIEQIRFKQSAIHIRERLTPTAVADFGALYTKVDNKLYFQDGAGAEHEVAFV